MKSTRKYLLLGLGVVLLLALLSGCEVTVGPEPRYGEIKICTDDRASYGYDYIDDDSTVYCIDGAEWDCDSCTTGWITVTLDQRHYLEVWDSESGTTTYHKWFTPTRDGQVIWISN